MGDAKRLWDNCCTVLQSQVSDGVWKSTFHDTRAVTLDGDRLVLEVPSGFARERIEHRYRSLVSDALLAAHGEPVDLIIAIAQRSANDTAAPPPEDHQVDEVIEHVTTALASPNGARSDGPGPLYTFDTFVTGPSNRFAHAAALAVAETPGRAYNPLFIYGDAGLGKTHLLQAIRNYIRENYPTMVVRYLSTESFLNDFVESIRLSQGAEFKRRYREVDILLVDDVQFIEKAERFQEEFFHTFNDLHDKRSQIVLTSDRSPDAIGNLEKRLRTRFKMGLITDIQPPDVETRTAILRRKAEKAPIPVSDDVLDFIALNITDNIRELEGALTRVTAYANLYESDLTVSLAEQVLSDILGESQPRAITPAAILERVATRYGFSVEEIIGKSRRRPLVTARQVAMYVVRQVTDLSYPAIAREFGGRDHTTVMHAVAKIEALMAERKPIFHQVHALIQESKKAEQ